ncbi:right-handed parallel beta-helix repeat-containing protein [candidate division KSB1 bacterium]|nr:right-handed parallel beta-helix repeat-containing protein [candidate division KSB1 bacterium]
MNGKKLAQMVFTFLFILSSIIQLNAQIIPAADRVNWLGAGLYTAIPACVDTVFQVNLMSGATWDAKVAAAISSAQSYIDAHPMHWAIIYFPAGIYSLSTPIILNRANYNYRNIIFQGAGSNKTALHFSFNGTNQNCFEICGYQQEGSKRYLASNLAKDSNSIQCTSTIGYMTPCWIRLCEEDHPYNDSWAHRCVGQITRMESTMGNNGTLKDTASKQYTVAYHTAIWPIVPVMNIGIENLTIKRIDSGSPGAGNYGLNIFLEFAVNCWVKGVHFDQTCKHHLVVRLSSHIYVSGCYFHDARSFEDGGYGYGVNLTESVTNCLVENNIFHKFRHAMLVQAGSNCNVFAFNYSYEQCWTAAGVYYPGDWQVWGYGPGGDICLHGNYPYANLFEHNYCERIVADSHHGDNWEMNTIVRNRVTNDHDSDRSWIYMRRAPKSNILGNMRSAADATEVEYSYCDMYRDIFGFPGSYGYNHNYFFFGLGDEEYTILEDSSYYYAARPAFLSLDYTWPSIGPSVSGSGSLTQSIPAKARFSQAEKTCIDSPVAKVLTFVGSMPYDQTWSGMHNLTGSVTIPTGITLTIDPGATITIPTGARLQVNGLLTAVGDSNSIITFDRSGASNTWYGIQVDTSGHATLKYCHIKNASYGVYANQSAPEVKNCIFEDNYHAFYAYYGMRQNYGFENNQVLNSTALYDIHIDHPVSLMIANCEGYNGTSRGLRLDWANYSSSVIDNKFHGYGQRCVTLNHSTPIFLGNMMYDNVGHGLYINNDSDPELIFDDYPGENVMAYNGLNGVYISGNSYPIIGGVTNPGQEAASNCWYGNGTSNGYMDIQYLGTPMLDATYNWWGTANPANYRYLRNNNLDVSNGLIENPCPDPHSLPKKSVDERELIDAIETNTVTNSDKDAVQLFEKARQLQWEKQYQSAIMIYQQIINDYPTSHEAEMACVRLMRCYQLSENKTEGKSMLGSIATRYTDSNVGMKAAEVLADQEVRDGNISTAITYYTNLSTTKNNRSNEALFELWKIYFNISKNKDQAQSLLALYENQYGLDENLLFMKLAMGLISGDEAAKLARELEEKLYKKQAPTEIWEIPETFELHANHPNPFNPVTRIDYELPEAGRVKIEIYNILGERIIVLVNREMSAGRYFELWNARNSSGHRVSSGIYFCRMQTAQFTKTIKMTLLP